VGPLTLLLVLAVSLGAWATAASGAGATVTPLGPLSVGPGPQPGSYSISWANTDPPSGFVFDIQTEPAGTDTWTDLVTGTTARGETFTPTVPGPYSFRRRLRNTANDQTSNWSTVLTLAGDWPMFRFNAQHSGATPDATIGASSAAHLVVRWSKLATPFKDFVSSPAVAFDAQLGKPLVYSATVSGTISARDVATGAVVWSSSGYGTIESSPVVFGNTVYVGTLANRLIALDATTGYVECAVSLPGSAISSPVVGAVDNTGPVIFFGDQGANDVVVGHEWAVNGVGNSNGACTPKWVFAGWNNIGPSGNRTGSWSPPALTTDATGRPLLVFGSSDPDDSVYALDARTGSLVWRFQTLVTTPDDDVGAAPAIGAPGVNGFRNGVVYIDGKDKIEYALDLSSGARRWQFNMAKRSGGANANSQSATALVGNRVVVPYAGYVFELNAITGKQVWRSARAPGTYYSSPAISGVPGDQVIVLGDAAGIEHAYRFRDGVQVLQVKTHGAIYASAAIAFGAVFFASDDGYLYALG
jgi:outer membrane protein assembly factor BamB